MNNRKISLFQKVKKGTIIKRKPKVLPSLVKNIALSHAPEVIEKPTKRKFFKRNLRQRT